MARAKAPRGGAKGGTKSEAAKQEQGIRDEGEELENVFSHKIQPYSFCRNSVFTMSYFCFIFFVDVC